MVHFTSMRTVECPNDLKPGSSRFKWSATTINFSVRAHLKIKMDIPPKRGAWLGQRSVVRRVVYWMREANSIYPTTMLFNNVVVRYGRVFWPEVGLYEGLARSVTVSYGLRPLPRADTRGTTQMAMFATHTGPNIHVDLYTSQLTREECVGPEGPTPPLGGLQIHQQTRSQAVLGKSLHFGSSQNVSYWSITPWDIV